MWNRWVPDRALQSRNPDLQTHGSHNPEGYFWHPISRTYFQTRISPRFCFKIPSPDLQRTGKSRIMKSRHLIWWVHQIKRNIICYLVLSIDCVLHVYLCNRLKFLEISDSEYPQHHRCSRLRAVSFFLVRRQNARDTQTTTRVTEGARRERPSFIGSPQHSRGRALPLLNLKKKRDCSQSIWSRNIIHESAKIFAFSSIKT